MNILFPLIFAICASQVAFASPVENNIDFHESANLGDVVKRIKTDLREFLRSRKIQMNSGLDHSMKKINSFMNKELPSLETSALNKIRTYVDLAFEKGSNKNECFNMSADYLTEKLQAVRKPVNICLRNIFWATTFHSIKLTEKKFDLLYEKIMTRIDKIKNSESMQNELYPSKQEKLEIEKIWKSVDELKNLEEIMEKLITKHVAESVFQAQSCLKDPKLVTEINIISADTLEYVRKCVASLNL